MKKLILPLCIGAILAWFFQPVYMSEAGCNWFLLWIIIGIPFGMRRMLVIIPRESDLGASIGITAFCFVIGGLIGGLVLAYELAEGVLHLFFKRSKAV